MDVQLDYSDVLIVPRQSSVNSRSDVNLMRTIGRVSWTGVPIVAANMATIGTLFLSVLLYILLPVILAQLWRRRLLARGGAAPRARQPPSGPGT